MGGAARAGRWLHPPKDRSGAFTNWSRSVRSGTLEWHQPTSEGELAGLVRRAHDGGRRLRVVGAGHSFSAIAAPDQVAVSLDRWTGICGATADAVTVRAGTRLRDLNAALSARGLALPILGSITRQSVAGVLGTGTHGSSLKHGNLSSLATGLRLITGAGEPLDLLAGDPRLDGARVHLGALGAISEVTLRVVPAFCLAESIENVRVRDVAARLDEIAHSAEYVKVFWLPHTELAQVYRYERTDEPVSRRPSPRTERWIDERVVHGLALPAVIAAHRRRPQWIPGFNRRAARTYLNKKRRVGPSELLLTTPNPVRHRETEAALPLAAAGDAFARTVKLIDTLGVNVSFIVEVRFVRGDDGWLSPAYGGDVVQLGAYTADEFDRQRYFDGFWHEMRGLGARPHWGKELDHGADEIDALYPKATAFRALRDQLDPERVFTNAFVDRVLGA